MVSIEALIIVSTIVFCVGALIGAFISRKIIPPQQDKDLEKRLHASQQQHDRYQQEVTDHFAETSRLIHNLNHTYKEIHQHLSSKAIKLASPEVSKKILEAGNKLELESEHVIEQRNLEAPKDWAPKTPGDTGTLSEEFGLRDEREDPGIEALTATNKKPIKSSH